MNPVLDVGKLRVDRGDVRAEHAVGEHALRIAIDQRCDVRDPLGRHCPTAHGKVAFGDDGPLSGDRTVDKRQDATTRRVAVSISKGTTRSTVRLSSAETRMTT